MAFERNGGEAFHLVEAAARFRKHLNQVRATVPHPYFDWYPYDSLTNADHLTRLLAGSGHTFEDLAALGPVLDVGCADGEFSFFIESLGAKVTAIDHPRSSHNAMQGVRALKQALNSPLDIRTIDLDGQFEMPRDDQFGLACVLGILYHLKNPIFVLEKLSRHATYCILSTRIASHFSAQGESLQAAPAAYLLGELELNGDPSNYWIFTEAGLERLFERTNWKLLAKYKCGATAHSLPNTMDSDERMFCLLKNDYGFPTLELGAGWHQPEDSGWRWTTRRFAAATRDPHTGSLELRMELYVPDQIVTRFGAVTLSITVNGRALEPQRLAEPGLVSFTRHITGGGIVNLEFELDHALEPSANEQRELGVIVAKLEIG